MIIILLLKTPFFRTECSFMTQTMYCSMKCNTQLQGDPGVTFCNHGISRVKNLQSSVKKNPWVFQRAFNFYIYSVLGIPLVKEETKNIWFNTVRTLKEPETPKLSVSSKGWKPHVVIEPDVSQADLILTSGQPQVEVVRKPFSLRSWHFAAGSWAAAIPVVL